MSEAPIVFDRLTRYFGANKALDTFSLQVPQGSIFALLGRNGAGKTTALSCLLGFLDPTRGSARLLGHDCRALPPEVRGRVGYVAEGQRLIPWMRVKQIVRFQKATFPGFDADLCRSYIERLGLPEKARVKHLSRGMRAQLALALALAPRPEVIILDDPAMGLDTVVRREFLEVMIDLIQEEGRTLLMTSHILSDVERVADQVAILSRGVLRVCGPIDEVKERIRRYHAVFEQAPPDVRSLPGVVRVVVRRNEVVLTVANPDGEFVDTLRTLGASEVHEEGLSLEDLFVDYTAVTGKEGGDASDRTVGVS